MPAEPALLSEALAEFILGPVAIALASRSAGNAPSLARGGGCRVAPDRRRITVFLARSGAEQLLADVADQDLVAVTFGLPGPEEAVQIKGDQVRLAPLEAADVATLEPYRRAWVERLTSLGYPAEFARAKMSWPEDDMLALSFTPRQVFNQTPGPRAGDALAGAGR